MGDTRSAALISRSGSVDWLCLPRFDGEPVFGRLLDLQHGGVFKLAIDGAVEARAYRPETAVLETRWRGPTGTATVTDAMPVNVKGMLPQLAIVRHVACTSGEVEVQLRFNPRLGMPGRPPRWSRRDPAVVCEWGSLALAFQCLPGNAPNPDVGTAISLSQGASLSVVVSMADRTPAVLLTQNDVMALIEETDRDWRRWAAEIEYSGPFRDAVIRSLITLRLLIYSPSGAPVAAPTTSLPERIGGDLNWDYRFSWPRDAAIGSGAFLAAGRREEAQAFLRWLEIASRLTLPRMKVLYSVDGTSPHRERELHNVSGYHDSLPVRTANAASDQHQLDVYGWVVDTGWHLASRGARLDGPSWRMIRALADFVAGCWRDPDAGIWEERGELRQHVSSKLLAFVALDRAIRIAQQRGEARLRRARWERQRDLLRIDIQQRGWNPSLSAYTAAYGSDDLDASVLLITMSELEGSRLERIKATIDAVRQQLGAGGVLLYRYRRSKNQPANEGAFLACSFWLIEALARCGAVDEAETLMSEAIRLGGELGLLAEQVDPATSESLGNFPQALSHSTLVGAALAIEAAKG